MPKPKIYKVLHWLDMGIFPGYVMFSCGFTYSEVMKMLKKNKKATNWALGLSEDKKLIEGGNYFGLKRELENIKTGEKKKMFYIFVKEDFKFTDYEYCKLAHEILHICQFYLPDLLNRDREIEAEAYLHTHLMMQCLKVLRQKGEDKRI